MGLIDHQLIITYSRESYQICCLIITTQKYAVTNLTIEKSLSNLLISYSAKVRAILRSSFRDSIYDGIEYDKLQVPEH